MDIGSLLVGFFIGGNFGVFLMAVLSVAKDADQLYEDDPPEWAEKYMGELPKSEDDDDDPIQGE